MNRQVDGDRVWEEERARNRSVEKPICRPIENTCFRIGGECSVACRLLTFALEGFSSDAPGCSSMWKSDLFG